MDIGHDSFNKLVEGMPHSIENSAILLALSAWHLFPNMSVLSTENHFIKQDDPLIDARGILTLGLQSTVSIRNQGKYDDIGRGITWSLPLAYYRFYGGPVEKENTLNTDGTRISVPQLLLIALGSAFGAGRDFLVGGCWFWVFVVFFFLIFFGFSQMYIGSECASLVFFCFFFPLTWF